MARTLTSAAMIATAALLVAACSNNSGNSASTSTSGAGTTTSTTTTQATSTKTTTTSTEASASASVSAEEEAASAEAHAQAEASGGGASQSSVVGIGVDVPAPEGFDPLGTGMVFEGSIEVTTTDAASLDNDYAISTGQIALNLANAQPLAQGKTVNIYVNSGAVDVALPKNVPVRLSCTQGGEKCGKESYNTKASGNPLTLNIQVGQGAVNIAE